MNLTGRIRFLGNTDEITTCDCCGKSNLKSTVAIENNGDVLHFGTTCAARALATDAASVRKAARAADVRNARAAELEASRALYAARLVAVRTPGTFEHAMAQIVAYATPVEERTLADLDDGRRAYCRTMMIENSDAPAVWAKGQAIREARRVA